MITKRRSRWIADFAASQPTAITVSNDLTGMESGIHAGGARSPAGAENVAPVTVVTQQHVTVDYKGTA